MSFKSLDYIQRRLFEIDNEIDKIWDSYDQNIGMYGDAKFGYNQAWDDTIKLEREARWLVELLKKISTNI